MKSIVITGASTGIGFSLAKVFIAKGYRVFGSIRKQADADRLQTELGEAFTPLRFDVTDDKAVLRAAAQVAKELDGKGLDGLINNAGIAVNGPIQSLEMEEFRQQFDVNFFGLVATTKAFLELLGARKNHNHEPGTIINISSVAGKLTMPFLGPYSASKHAVEAFSQALRREMALFGIKVIIVGPGAIKTPIWDKMNDPIQRFKGSAYERGIGNVLKEFRKQEREALPSDTLAEKVLAIFENPKAKPRYSILNGYMTNYWIPRFALSDKMLDSALKKLLTR